MFTSHLLFAFTILRHMVTVYGDCNYVDGRFPGSRATFDLCIAMDEFDNSYKLEYKPDLQWTVGESVFIERIYATKNCEGDSRTSYFQRKTDSMKSGTGNTCGVYLFVDETINVVDGARIVPATAITDVYKESNSRVSVESSLYNDCTSYASDLYFKVTGCMHIYDDSNNRKEAMTRIYYRDDKCTEELPENTWFNILGGGYKALYKKEIQLGDVSFSFRDFKGTNGHDRIMRDIVCTEQAPIKTSKAAPAEWNPRPQTPQFYEPNDQNWSYLAVNVLISAVSTLCVISVCLAAYNWMKRRSGLAYAQVQWAKEVDTEA